MIQSRPISTIILKDNYIWFVNQTLELDYNAVNYEPGNTFTFILPVKNVNAHR